MKKISIILRIAAVLAAVLSLSLFLLISDREKSLEGQILASKKAAKNAEEMRAELQAKNASMIEKQEKLGENLAAEKAKAGSFYQQSVVARGEIAKLKADLEEFRVSVGEKEEELSRLKGELIGLTTAAVSLSAVYSNSRVNDEVGQPGKRNGSTKRDNTSHLQNDADTRQKGSTLRKDSTLRGAFSLKGKILDGTILRIGPENSIVAISLGSSQGVAETMLLSIRDSSGEIARIVLSKVLPDFSIATVLPGFGSPLRLKIGEQLSFIVI